MKIYYTPSLLFLLLLTGCWSYKPKTHLSKSPVVKSLVEVKTQISTEKSTEEQIKSRWHKSLKKDEMQQTTLYDFTSPLAKEYRSIASAPQEKLSSELSLDLLICLTYERNSSLKNAKKKVESVKQRYSQTFFLQNLLSQYSSFTRTINTKVGMQAQSPTVDMKTPQPSRSSIMGEIINTEVKMVELEYTIVLRDLINKITKDYADLVYAQESLHIQQEHKQIVSALENTTRDKFRAGLTGYADVLKLQILKANIEEDTKTYEERLKTVKVSILTTLELPTDLDLGIPLRKNINKLQTNLNKLYDKGLHNRQEIQMVALKSQKLEQVISLAKDKLYPDFTTGLSYFENRNKERVGAGKQEEPFSDRIKNMPRFDFGQRDSYIQEMIVKNAAIKENLQDTKQKTINKIRDLYFKIDTSWRQVTLHEKKLIPLAKEALKVTRVSYQAGKKVDFLDVLDTERTLLNLSLMLAKFKREYQWHVADLQKTIGLFEVQ